MKKVVGILALTLVGLMIIILLFGCGVSQEEYNRVSTQLRDSQAQVTELQREYSNVNADLRDSQSQVVELQSEIRGLKEQYEIVGETPTETAENIVKWYHETHIYSKYDFFVCSDMALDVWNMLKAQGIDALIQIGNVETGAENITEANHAWVLAETSPGKYLALETTAGYLILREDKPLYYEGWSFDNPREYKRFVELKQEFNIRRSIALSLASHKEKIYEEYEKEHDYYLELIDEFNMKYVGHPVSLEGFNFRYKIETQLAIVKEKEGRYKQLNDLIDDELKESENIVSEMKGLLQ